MSVAVVAPESQLVPYSLETKFRYSRSSSEQAIQQMVQFSESLALPLMCVDASSGLVVANTDDDFVEILPSETFAQLVEGPLPKVVESTCGLTFYAVPLPQLEGLQIIGIGYLVNHSGRITDELLQLGVELSWEMPQLAEWCARQKSCSPEVLSLVLQAYCERECRESLLTREITQLRRQNERGVDQVQFLHRILGQLTISQNTDNLNDACLMGLQYLTSSAGCAVIWELGPQRRLEIKHGRIPVTMSRLPSLIDHCVSERQSDPIIRQNVVGTLLGADFPGLQSLLLCPIREGSHVTGWVCLFNRTDQEEFDQTDVALAETVATLIVTHTRNREIYEAHDELLLQFVGSLVTTIDAKDSYTRGHSERVAAIAKCLAKQLKLADRDQHDCFNAGLLHDIGKIGVNDAILQKTDALTAEEYEHVKQHPMIGYRILRGLKSMHRLLPGVRSHHEEFTGGGYPDRLKGTEIPLLARILSVADAFDAMRSDRPYRRGMPQSQVDHIFRNGAGKQWDPDVVGAYFAARNEIRKIGGPEIWSDDEPHFESTD